MSKSSEAVQAAALPAVLTIAGSDSGGGAGVQADLKTFMANSTYGLSVITAITAQNTKEVRQSVSVDPVLIEQQLDAVFDDIDIKAAKTGMLADAQSIDALVIVWTKKANGIPLVVDPVMVATTGRQLLDQGALDSLCSNLLPLATVVTPNLRETEAILGLNPGDVDSVEKMENAAQDIAEKYKIPVVVVKGGHLEQRLVNNMGKPLVVDIVYLQKEDRIVRVESLRVDSSNTHGTGCTLSAAIAANLANGVSHLAAVRQAIRYVNEAIQAAYPIGHGHGPVNHSYALQTTLIPRPTLHQPNPFTEYLKSCSHGLWKKYTAHRFVQQAGTGVLDRSVFIYYLKQDYMYLKHYARSYALAAFKSDSQQEIAVLSGIAQSCIRESELHIRLCGKWGIGKGEMDRVEESWANVAYTRYILDRGFSGDILELMAAMYPCLLGYSEAAIRQVGDPQTVRDGNPYWPWLEYYVGSEFQTAVENGRRMIESMAQREMPSAGRLNRLVKTFSETVSLEIAFWDNALDLPH
ncbi:trifunctional hydroxymethylpyrimidine kinase/phosphomethylpyrimidine kinase/thiaminase [Coemansia spiralis]|uniref:Trifunctional hydroxymethylpyrimidine kinase/phosphomethylpyrimidine kinase/thiaminase n=2 Tax=Coemansia TaxID=4863 RepID=A0A9W8L1D3_9FUNG|nr:Phosphomethylpyrimidine kinase-domain-containing protein [Coemansia spiralis]KAJ1989885.1 trifunctional hydroxymethylpyrimidine kinase/phosphomethylpyrimidine kinase/thiaminase [Coemansia umbellata]KAJ2623115.1 trifunctional hydroxymethylpyrimidine kinase/phosphomethylpyrimidine kinase/thiaminase [Coemansia sp. RSA 1358]KAJ2681056.1 trifunctional hydroxymethylpyrimidine kinase/phosphomethylpyrimidine kinase/thiaminase [Coemansia spiralis]